jgi:hypothetical protein
MKSYSQRRSKLQEKRAARDVGGNAQKGSGSSGFAKGDFRNVGNVRGECKHTSKSTYILKEEDLKKIQMEALKGGFEDWVMQVEFLGAVGRSKKFAVVDCKMFMEMWVEARPSNYTSLSSSSIAQIGKSFQLKVSDVLAHDGLHVTQLAFMEDKEAVLNSKVYVIVPWQAYLDVRKSYLERAE